MEDKSRRWVWQGCGGGGGTPGHVGSRRRLLRDQVLLTLFALDVLGLGAGHGHVGGEGLVVQQVVEGVQVVLLVVVVVGWEEVEVEGGVKKREKDLFY